MTKFTQEEVTVVYRLLEQYQHQILDPLPDSWIKNKKYVNWEVLELIWSIKEKLLDNQDK